MHSGNKKAAMEIIYETDPVVAKHTGDIFRGNQDWEKIAYRVMGTGVREKFTQNSDLASMLQSTGKKIFLELQPSRPLLGNRNVAI